MPSTEVLDKLEILKEKLAKLEPAIKHVETAQHVTESVRKIPEQHVELLEQLKKEDLHLKADLKMLFQNDLSDLTAENKRIQQTTADFQIAAQKEQTDLVKEVKNLDLGFKAELQTLFASKLSELVTENKNLQITTGNLQQVVKAEQEALNKALTSVQAFHSRVEGIQFPERLDKLDANIAGTIATVQSLQGRFDGLERNIADRLRDIVDYQKETRQLTLGTIEQAKSTLSNTQQAASKRQQIFTYITWVIIIAVALGIYFLK